MNLTGIKTLAELKKANYKVKPIKQELKDNLIATLKAKKNPFPNIHGYEHTVIPELERAILSKHNINLLGLRGQAKTKIARLMIDMLDEYIPIIEGSEVMDDPFAPMSYYGKQQIDTLGDQTPIAWVHRSDRFSEKLATPDVTIADLIGDVDPIKAVNQKLTYADERVIHFGMIPRANRCIFVINELPDLQARIQVSLFNILQEGDVQIRGFKFRFPLDMQFIFTANPEDYTNRGSIITPLKDRIGAQILTHYPETIELARMITEQEAKLDAEQLKNIYIPDLARDLVEQITFEARESEFIDDKSGVSARLSISALEALVSSAELRCLKGGYDKTKIRLSDFASLIPAMTGKMELVYEGEQEGSRWVSEQLIGRAIATLFLEMYPNIEKLEKPGVDGPYTAIIDWFLENDGFTLQELFDDKAYDKSLKQVKPLLDLIKEHMPETNEKDMSFMQEFILWALVEHNKISKNQVGGNTGYSDNMPSFSLNDF
jgi:magnesium chelatase subunit I